MCLCVNGGGYCGLVGDVTSSEQVQCDRLAANSVVRIIFPVLREEDGAVVDGYNGSSFNPRICGTKTGFSHSVVHVKRKQGGFLCIIYQVLFMFGVHHLAYLSCTYLRGTSECVEMWTVAIIGSQHPSFLG